VGVRNCPEGQRFAAWWQAQLLYFARNDPASGQCGDQRWLDLVPVLFPQMGIVRHHGANVAYWNLPERQLQRSTAGEWCCANGDPLLFFHFSGFNPRQPQQLSHFQNRFPPRNSSPGSSMFSAKPSRC
ncbi:MAG TPA: glycosyl transferase, partial [Candidatus Wallbacteria bacterium]|nr:glycosyl transferase [Candidatus Wallbacteria bacterium]